MTIIMLKVVRVSSALAPRWPWVLSAAWIGAVPVARVAVPIVRAQAAAEWGSNSPATALLKFAYTFEDPTTEIGASRLIVPSRRRQIMKLRRDYLAAMEADRRQHNDPALPRFVIGSPPPLVEREWTEGDKAVTYRVQWTVWDTNGNPMALKGVAEPWRAEARRESNGWCCGRCSQPGRTGEVHSGQPSGAVMTWMFPPWLSHLADHHKSTPGVVRGTVSSRTLSVAVYVALAGNVEPRYEVDHGRTTFIPEFYAFSLDHHGVGVSHPAGQPVTNRPITVPRNGSLSRSS